MRTVWSPSGTSNLCPIRREDVHFAAVDEELILPFLQKTQPDLPPLQRLDGERHLRLTVKEPAEDGAAVDGQDRLAFLPQDRRRVRDLDLVVTALDEDPRQPPFAVRLEDAEAEALVGREIEILFDGDQGGQGPAAVEAVPPASPVTESKSSGDSPKLCQLLRYISALLRANSEATASRP